ncbi:MAG: phosphoglucomutase (alpha-D-glucose-1,6-bisphosphate-dependent) [Gemmatimonadota bacterium]|nr:phosphoglucomutase (alpha-D-glucose-1,6-bisphosphate-dependent) [Gemmatimonadota bacterium]
MSSDLAGKPAPAELLVDIPRLMTMYFAGEPDARNAEERVAFGTSGHRGTSFNATFNEGHIVAIASAICDYRRDQEITGPLFLGADTHALSEAAHTTAIEVFAARGVELRVAPGLGYTSTPAVSHAILTHNLGRTERMADGVVITPSHNPPEDGGFKYNPPTGGPADTEATRTIEERANRILERWRDVPRISLRAALELPTTREYNYTARYVEDLSSVIDMEAICSAGLRIGADPMGGAAAGIWEPIAERYKLRIEVVNPRIDPTFSFMTVDGDGRIRMDCSSRFAMAGLINLRDHFDLAFGNDPDADRHGIVTPAGGLLPPNHYLAVAIEFLFTHRPGWSSEAGIGKTLVSSSMIDRVAHSLGRRVDEVPVGFKWFVEGLLSGAIAFGGEESAGASFLRHNGAVWTTDKDGILLNLLAAEILAVTGRDPFELYRSLEERFGSPVYKRIDAPADSRQKAVLRNLSPEMVTASTLAGEPISARLARAPANNAPIGGLKVVTENGWFAARPSGTEEIYKIYAESFLGEPHLDAILEEAQEMVDKALEAKDTPR